MTAPICALDVPGDEDLSPLTRVLWRDALPHRVVFQDGRQLVLVADPAVAERVRSLYVLGPAAAAGPEARPVLVANVISAALRRHPATACIVLIALLLAPVGIFENRFATTALGWLTFTHVVLAGDTVQVGPLAQVLAEGQWWRLITPSWLHFSLFHIAADVVLFWEFGRRIETRLGSPFLVGLFLWASLAANIAQYWLVPHAIFGGLSGVVIAQLGFSMVVGRTRTYGSLLPNPAFAIAMLISLLVFSTGITERFGLNIANGAHWAGLAAGVLLGFAVLIRPARRR